MGPDGPGVTGQVPWYVRPALEGHRANTGRRRSAMALSVVGAVAMAGCGDVPNGGLQDVDEPPGRYPVQVTATFPAQQKLARRSSLKIVVRNTGRRVLPNVAVTLGSNRNQGKTDAEARVGTFDRVRRDRDLSDPKRPQFVLNKAPIDYFRQRSRPTGSVVEAEVRADTGDDPTYNDTYDLGRLPPGKTASFRWNVTAVEAGPYVLQWRVVAGLDGRAKAVLADGGIPKGVFTGAILRDAPGAKVNFQDGNTIDQGPGSGSSNGGSSADAPSGGLSDTGSTSGSGSR